ncbi:hypothetical protein BDV3_006797 [Batrachochytrium dendrobatidis]|uniref:Coiled-coil domain-containing protein 39 n=2 Tax=Batrachochytrium dendrobatidis (strain JEL423) TaxID=403673 RepID=A0A177WRE2_BATDL|nr:hypothetical protein BDEG_26118 [Batrachochytrium dendrobatidis JEL423]
MLSSANLTAAGHTDLEDNQYVHSLPSFANEQNKELSRMIKVLEAKRNSFVATAEDNYTRGDSIIGHMKNVQQELHHTQALYNAKGRQIETEEHFKQLSERESGRLALEIKRLGKDITDITDHLNTMQNNVYRGNERIEAIRTELKLENEELAEWLRVQSEKEEDNMALLKYSKEDEAKIKELNLSMEKYMHEVNKKKAILSAEVTETQVAQIELDRTTEAFKQLHQERQTLISQWEAVIDNMKKRDQDIERCQATYQDKKEVIRNTQEQLKDRQEFFNQQLTQNSEIEKSITMCERNIAKSREQHVEATTSLQQYKNEVEVLRNTLNKSAIELVNKKNELTNLKIELQERHKKLNTNHKVLEAMKQKRIHIDDDTMTMEAKSEEIQAILKQEEIKDKELDHQTKVLREAQFKKSQELFKYRQEEKNLAAEIVGGETSVRNLKTKINKLDQEALRQRAVLYTIEFQIQQLERKLRRAQGDRTDEEKENLLKRIETLNFELDQQSSRWTLLNSQLKRSQEGLRHAKRQLDQLTKTKESIITNIDELTMYNESASHQLIAKTKEKEEVMVEENILRLELRKLRGFLNARSDKVFNLESHQMQLQLALEERGKEIDIHKDMLCIQIKNAEEERHSAAAELRERVGKVEKLKKRFEILVTQFAPEEDQEDHSQAFYVIKAAQEREELQRKGDELDANIRRAEKEIKALENTLKLMNDRNESYRMNLYRAELDSKDIQHKEMLETEYRQVIENYKSKREIAQDLQQQLHQLEQLLIKTSGDESEKLKSVQLLEAKLQNIYREIQDQQIKRDRANKMIETASKKLRVSKGQNARSQEPTQEELDFGVRKAREVSTAILTELNKLGVRFPEFGEILWSHMQQQGVLPPSRQLSRVSSRAASVVGNAHDDRLEFESLTSQRNSRSGSRAEQTQGTAESTQFPKIKSGSQSSGIFAGTKVGHTIKISTTNLNETVGLPQAEPRSRSESVSSIRSDGQFRPSRVPANVNQRLSQQSRSGSASSMRSSSSQKSYK